MNFVFEQIRTGGDRNFGYLVGDRPSGVAVAIDPSFTPEVFDERARAQGLTLRWIASTHGHADHTNGNAALRARTRAEILAPPRDFQAGPLRFSVLAVPGHTPDHVLFWLPEWKIAMTGDLLFVGKIGGTSTEGEARTEYESLQRVLATLPDDTTIWPGHDYGCRPSSTIALERATNPFLAAPDFAAFLRLKREWPDFKIRHGLR